MIESEGVTVETAKLKTVSLRIPVGLWRQVKVAAAQKGETIQAYVAQLLEKAVQK